MVATLTPDWSFLLPSLACKPIKLSERFPLEKLEDERGDDQMWVEAMTGQLLALCIHFSWGPWKGWYWPFYTIWQAFNIRGWSVCYQVSWGWHIVPVLILLFYRSSYSNVSVEVGSHWGNLQCFLSSFKQFYSTSLKGHLQTLNWEHSSKAKTTFQSALSTLGRQSSLWPQEVSRKVGYDLVGCSLIRIILFGCAEYLLILWWASLPVENIASKSKEIYQRSKGSLS